MTVIVLETLKKIIYLKAGCWANLMKTSSSFSPFDVCWPSLQLKLIQQIAPGI